MKHTTLEDLADQFDAVFIQKIYKVRVSFRLRFQIKNELGLSESDGVVPLSFVSPWVRRACVRVSVATVNMGKKRILYVSQEISPYTKENKRSNFCMNLPQVVQEKDNDIRIFMPKFGTINERRHQLHEVIRLSGMNLVINDIDMPLIIKVASIPKERMQVYFIDNEDYFKRKQMLLDTKGKGFKDNDERMIFFTKGVLETVKKLNWSPDVINCHGWFTSLFPLYMKTYFKNEPIFKKSKIVTSVSYTHLTLPTKRIV